MLFLAKIYYETSEYGNDDHEQQEVYHIVKADAMVDAEEKARKYYEDKTVDYSIYYNVFSVTIMEMIK